MTPEQKAKAYDEALEKARKHYGETPNNVYRAMLESLFPELKESEDERIRKEIIQFLRDYHFDRLSNKVHIDTLELWAAWLEKQGEQSKEVTYTHEVEIGNGNIKALVTEKVKLPKFKVGDYVKNINDKREPIYEIVYIDKECYICEYRGKENIGDKAVIHFAFNYPYLRHTQKPADKVEPKFKVGDIVQCITDSTDIRKIEEVDTLCNMYHTGSSPIMFEIEDEWKILVSAEDVKQDEQKSVARYKVGDTIYYDSFGRLVSLTIANIVEDGTDNPMYEDKDGNSVFQNDIVEQKPSDKVEPKFHEGDWVIDSQGLTHQIKRVLENVTTHTFGYDIVGGGYFNDDTAGVHLWTIQDAKDGDVLAGHECIVLFKEIDGLNIKCHCTYHFMNNPSFYVNTLQNKSAFHPATKEQRDLLFKEMKEADYELDAERKELKKIKQKSAWSEEDKCIALGVEQLCNCASFLNILPDKINKIKQWLKSLKDRVQPQSQWNPSDEFNG